MSEKLATQKYPRGQCHQLKEKTIFRSSVILPSQRGQISVKKWIEFKIYITDKNYNEDYKYHIVAYTLMTNHIHLIIETEESKRS
ncbi:transposase [Clostridium gasigenes]|nr:transposase [Clostridium gasigenes]